MLNIKKFIQKNSGIIFTILLILVICGALVIVGSKTPKGDENEPNMGRSMPNSKWFMISNFEGYQTKFDPEKISNGGNAQGQNTSINEGDRISNREFGYELFPTTATYITDQTRITSMHTFRKRNGENVMMRKWGDQLEYFEEGNDTWTQLAEGYTTSTEMDFADYNINTDLVSYTYFGDGVNNFSRWNGGHSLLSGALAGTEDRIVVDSIQGFHATGTVVYCGQESEYTFLQTTSSPTFVLSGTAVACADDTGIAQTIRTYADNPKGNIYLVWTNRLFIAGVTSTPQIVAFSEYGNAENYSLTDLVSDSTDTSPGVFNLGEGGGGVTGMAQDEGAAYIFKRGIIYKVTLNDTLYTIEPLKPFDGKSQTVGAVNNKSIFTGKNAVFFITPDNQIMALERVETFDYPQIRPISEIIQPTIDAMRFASSTGVVFQEKAYFAARMDDESQQNDTVLVWNIHTSQWDSPITGWNVNEWTIYNNDYQGSGKDELYFGDDTNANTFKVTNTPLDYIYSVASNWRSKQFTFGLPQSLKEIDNVFVEGYITDNTELTISLLLDDNGYTQTYQTVFDGNETDYLFGTAEYNVFGFSSFGTKRFGSNEEVEKTKFRVYLNKSLRQIPFYSAQIEFSSDGESQEWEITNFGFKVREHSQPMKSGLMREFN